MRSIIPQIRSSYMSLLGRAEITPDMLIDKTEDIRQLMLDEIGEKGEKYFPGLTRRVRYAPDVQGLWYVRSELMAMLSGMHGETIAQEKIARISSRFKGLIPQSLTAAANSSNRPR
ncbi:MAG: hypothetical protein V4772_21805 [Pseudomonadota bacterium]